MASTLHREPTTIIVPAGEFKAKCLKLMDQANEKQQSITVTKHGKPVGHFVPLPPEQKPFRSIFGRSSGIHVPNDAQWKKLKAEWATDWDASTEKLFHNFAKAKSKKQ